MQSRNLFFPTAAGRGSDRSPRLVARPAGAAGCAAAGAPREAFLSHAEIVAANRARVAEDLAGRGPAILIWLAISASFGLLAMQTFIYLADLEAALACAGRV